MRLPRNVDRLLLIVTVFLMSFTFSFMMNHNNNDTFADNEAGIFTEAESYFVTFYDKGTKLTVKTDAPTVGEAIKRVGILLNDSDAVEPALDTPIDVDNFFINIHRSRPVMITDGVKSEYVMTASFDAKEIAREAGMTVYDGDEIRQAVNMNFLEAGAAMAYEIIRNGGRIVTVEEEIAFGEEIVKDYNLEPGKREIRQLGEVGVKELSYEVFYENNVEVKRELIGETIAREPVTRVVAVGASEIERKPLTARMGANTYTVKINGRVVERRETYYDLPMSKVMANAARVCGVEPTYTVRDDGVKVDAEGYVLVAADLNRYPRCSVVETSLGLGKVYDTGSFALSNPEQFDLATDWTNHDGK